MKIIRKSDGAVFERDDEGRLASDRKGTGWDNQTGTYYGDSIEIVRTGTKGGAPDLYKQYRQEVQDAAEKRPGGFGNYGFGGSQNTKFNVLDYLGTAGKNLLHGMAEGAAATGAFAENKVADAAGWLFGDKELAKSMKETGLFNSLYHGNEDLHLEGIEKERERTAREMERNISGIQTGNETADRALRWAAKAGGDVSYSIGNALPMAAEALAGGPAAWPGVAESADDLVRMGASVVEKSGVLNTLSTAARNMLSSREYWTAFVSEIGSDYMDALNKGASEDDATAYALATALVNSGIEVGGGIQNGGADPLWKSSIEEGREEIDQGMTGRMMENIFLHRNNPLLSVTDEDAIINPVTALKEGAMGAAVGGILSAGQRGIASAVNNRAENNAYRDVFGADSEFLVQEALDIDPENKTAQEAQKRLEQGKKLSGGTLRQLVEDISTGMEERYGAVEETDSHGPAGLRMTEDSSAELAGTKNVGQVESALAENGSGGAARSSTSGVRYGNAGRMMYDTVRGMAANLDEDSYRSLFNVAYEVGRQTAGTDETRGLALAQEHLANQGLPESAVEAAYYAGREDVNYESQRGETINGTEQKDGIRVRDGSQWDDRTGTAGQAVRLEESTAGDQGRQTAGRPADRGATAFRYGTSQSTSAQLIGGRGSSADALHMVVGGDSTAVRQARQMAAARGLTAYVYAGGYMHVDGEEVRGYIRGNAVYVRADDPHYTADQIMRHEMGHDMVAKGEIDPADVYDRLEKKFGRENLGAIVQRYAEDYAGTGLTGEEIWEEVMCDSLGDMGVFAQDADELPEALAGLLTSFREETLATKRTTSGPPNGQKNTAPNEGGKMSRALADELFNDEFRDDTVGLIAVLKSNRDDLADMEPVARVTGKEVPASGNATSRAITYIQGRKEQVVRKGLGEVLFSKSKIKNSFLGHGFGEAKVQLMAAVPGVIEEGRQIAFSENWKNRGYDSYVFAGPTEYAGKKVYVAAIVIRDNASRYYLHEAVDENGNVIYKEKESPESASDRSPDDPKSTVANPEPSTERVPQTEEKSNSKNADGEFSRAVEPGSLKEMLDSKRKSEREILAEALANGAATTEFEREQLRRYQKHAADLDRIQEELNKQRSLIHGHEIGETTLSTAELQKAANRADILRKQLDREDRQLTEIRAMKPIRELLERQNSKAKQAVSEAERAAKLAGVQAEAMRARAAYWEKQTKLTDLPTMRADDVKKLVNGTIRDFYGKISAQDVLAEVQRAANHLALSRSETAIRQVKKQLEPVARRIVESARANANEDVAADAAAIREHLRSGRIALDEGLAAQMPEWNQWRKKYGSRIRMAEGGTPVDVAYEELTERFGNAWFPEDIVNPVDQLQRMGEVLDQTMSRQENPHGADLEAAAESCVDALVSGILSENMRQTAPTIADRWAAKLEKATREAREGREEALRRAREGREDTERRRGLRTRIAVMVRSLDRQFRNPTDSRHIPDALRPTVLELCSIFTGNRVDSVQQGQTVTVDDHAIFDKERLKEARLAYEKLKGNEEGFGELYDEQVAEDLERLEGTIAGRRLSELTYEELQDVSHIVDHIRYLAQTVDEIFINGRKLQIQTVANGFISNAKMKGSEWSAAKPGSALDALEKMVITGNLKPTYFFRRLQDTTMSDLWGDMMAGQSKYGLNMLAAREFKDGVMDRLGVNEWMDNKKVFATRDAAGRPMELTMQQAMSLLAAYKREQVNGATNHVLGGGFVFEEGVSREKTLKGRKIPLIREYKADTSPHTLTEDNIRAVAQWLEKQDSRTLEYVDEMVRYLSRDMAALGNETSMQLHGYKKFGEDYYFPMQSQKAFLDQQFDKAGEANRNFRNKGFTKRTVADANNPFVLRDFDTVWAEHVNQMLMYNALAVPQDNWNRMMNYRTAVDDAGHVPNTSVRAQFEETYGTRAMQYFDTLMKDINGGITTDPRAGTVNRLIALWKKSAVFASMSVAIQQPSAIARAMAVMNPKYLAETTVSRRDFKELQRWSGVAVIKSIGGFDTATGRTGAEWLMDNRDLREKIEGAMTVLPEKMDEITWAHLWNAVKAEIADTENYRVGSDEYFRRCAERFEEVVELTQVYDSVMTRSENMRSKDSAVKVMTAFMAEPTVTLNMAMEAVHNVQVNPTKESRAALMRTSFTLLASILFNNALKAIVTAPRDKDEDKTYIEKYLVKFVGGVKEDINPLNYFPVAKDLMELIDGYTVEASWTTVPKQFIQALNKLRKEQTPDNWVDFAAALSSLAGMPTKNIVRDLRGIWKTAVDMQPLKETDKRGVMKALEEGLGLHTALKDDVAAVYKADRKGDEKARKKALEEVSLEYEDKVKHFLNAGYDKEEAEKKARSSVMSTVTTYLKPLYQAAQSTAEKERIKSLALRFYIGGHQLYHKYNWKNWDE